MVNWLIERAKRTPYYHLDGYMNRWWLVPYRNTVKRVVYTEGHDVKVFGNGPLRPPTESYRENFFELVDTDGTGPVSFRKRPLAWCIQRCGIAIRVHEILRSDNERHPHSHPWSYLSIILRNYYLEERYDSEGSLIAYKLCGPGSVLWRPAGSLHRLKLDDGKPVTSLFITFKKQGSWGFQVDGKIVNHREYLGKQ